MPFRIAVKLQASRTARYEPADFTREVSDAITSYSHDDGLDYSANDSILNKGFRLFPSSSAAKGRKEGEKPSFEQVVFANLFKGEYF